MSALAGAGPHQPWRLSSERWASTRRPPPQERLLPKSTGTSGCLLRWVAPVQSPWGFKSALGSQWSGPPGHRPPPWEGEAPPLDPQ